MTNKTDNNATFELQQQSHLQIILNTLGTPSFDKDKVNREPGPSIMVVLLGDSESGLAIVVSSVLVKVGAFPSMSVKRGLTNVFSTIQDATTRAIFGRETVTMKGSFYDIVDVDMAGNKVPMSSFKNDVLLVVNVASKCGLTDRNYSQLSKLADEYGPRGLKILAFPCNQFMGQEPGNHEEICTFADKYKARNKLVWFEKGYVNGQDTRETYSYLKRELKAEDGSADIGWNFAKFLVDHEGKPFKRYGPTTDPVSIKGDIEKLIKNKEAS